MHNFLSGDRVYLRPLTKEDCGKQYLFFVNDAESLSFVEGIGHKTTTKEELVAYIESCNNPTSLLLGIFEKKTNIHMGNVHLSQIKPRHKNCIYGIVLHRDYVGKGYAYEASNLVIKYAFEAMDLHRIQINVVDKNERAIKLYQRLGAVEEGRLREAFRFKNKYHDVIMYSLLKEHIKKLWKK